MANIERRLILGGGISGLVCAYCLLEQGDDVTLLESQHETGGAIQTYHQSGYLTELGPNTIQVSSRKTEQLFSDIGLESEVMAPDDSAKKRYIVRDGRLHAVPAGIMAGVTTGLFRFSGKLRLIGDLLVSKRDDESEESLADFVRRRIGCEFLDYALNPMVGGIYAGDPEKLSVKFAFPKVYRLEQQFGGLIKGAIRVRRARKSNDTIPAKMLSFRDGMATLPQTLTQQLGDAVVKRAEIQSISRQQNGQWKVVWQSGGQGPVTQEFDSIIVTVPAHQIPGLPWNGVLASEMAILSSIEYPPVASVSLGFDRSQVEHPLDGFGMLVPEKEHRSILGTLFSSSMFADRAPAGKVNLTTFVGGARQPELAAASPDQLIELVMRDIRDLLGVSGHSEYSKITVWPRAIPQYNLGYGMILNAMESMERNWASLHFCGNYRNGISVEKCIAGAFELASNIEQNGR